MTPTQSEKNRILRQRNLDAEKTARERNELGQFATPSALADEIVSAAMQYLKPSERRAIRFLDPALGSGAFYSALLRATNGKGVHKALGVELDSRFAHAARDLWGDYGLHVREADFTRELPPIEADRANLLIANPPYVRHHHIDSDDKPRLKDLAARKLHIDVSGLAGLYVYFVLVSHEWLAEDGVAAWLIPSEWMDVNYGKALKQYLTERVTLLEIHLFDAADVQFGDALVSSSVIYFRRTIPSPDHRVRITAGGGLSSPHTEFEISLTDLKRQPKWSSLLRSGGAIATNNGPTIGDLFRIRRGVATGGNEFFIQPLRAWEQLGIPRSLLRPVLPPARYITTRVISTRPDHYPDLPEPLALLDCDLDQLEVQHQYPSLWRYLESPHGQAVREGYLARHRSPWYSQESRPPAPILSTYMGRTKKDGSSPFRFLFNRSQAVATNVYLMLYPQHKALADFLAEDPAMGELVASSLERLTAEHYDRHGRVYGGGLHKLEPKELARIPAEALLEELGIRIRAQQQELEFRELAGR